MIRTQEAPAASRQASRHRPCRAASQAGIAKARNSASLYPANRNTEVGQSSSASTAHRPVPGGPASSPSRESATIARPPATSEMSTPASTQSGTIMCTIRSASG